MCRICIAFRPRYWREEVEKNSTLKPVGDKSFGNWPSYEFLTTKYKAALNGHHCRESPLRWPAGLTGNDWPETKGQEVDTGRLIKVFKQRFVIDYPPCLILRYPNPTANSTACRK